MRQFAAHHPISGVRTIGAVTQFVALLLVVAPADVSIPSR